MHQQEVKDDARFRVKKKMVCLYEEDKGYTGHFTEFNDLFNRKLVGRMKIVKNDNRRVNLRRKLLNDKIDQKARSY